MKIFVFEIKPLGLSSGYEEKIEATGLHTALHRLGERLEKAQFGWPAMDKVGRKELNIRLKRVEKKGDNDG
jgi:hypothetical protein